MHSNLLNLKFAEFKIIGETISEIELPEYPGTTLRGAFGLSLKEVACISKKECKNFCKRPGICAYGYVFETPKPENSEIMRKYKYIPHPFILVPPLGKKRIYKEGEEIEFGLILIGKAINFLPYFIFSLIKMGNRGIGKDIKKGKGKFIVRKVYYKDKVVYDNSTDTMNIDSFWEKGDIFLRERYKNIKFIDLNFITPLRLIYLKKTAFKVEFHILIRNLLRRLGVLIYFHCSEKPDLDFIRNMIRRAKSVKLLNYEYNKVVIERYSMRQGRRVKYEGVIGRFRYSGDLDSFIPYLKLGEKIHVGKNTSFGFGKYKIEIY